MGFGPWSKEGPEDTHKSPERLVEHNGRKRLEFRGFTAYIDKLEPILDALAKQQAEEVTIDWLRQALEMSSRAL